MKCGNGNLSAKLITPIRISQRPLKCLKAFGQTGWCFPKIRTA